MFSSSILIYLPFKWIRHKEYKFCCFSFKPPRTYTRCVHAVFVLMKKKYKKKKEKRVIRVRQMDIAVVHMSNIYICEMILRKSCAQEKMLQNWAPKLFLSMELEQLNCWIVHGELFMIKSQREISMLRVVKFYEQSPLRYLSSLI